MLCNFWQVLQDSAPVLIQEAPRRLFLEQQHSSPTQQSWLKKSSFLLVLAFITLNLILTRKFYDLLEVPEDASEADLKKAYRKKCVYHVL